MSTYFSTRQFYTNITENKKVIQKELPSYLRNRNIDATIWTQENKSFIKQLKINDNLIIKYKAPMWIAHFFFWLGIILTGLSIYVIMNPKNKN